jgi:hypothetical protein
MRALKMRKALLCAALAFTGVAHAAPMVGLTSVGALVYFDSEVGAVLATVPVTGLGSERLVGIDTRPATFDLIGLTDAGRIVRIDGRTGVATALGAPNAGVLSGTAFGVDFNPTVDRIRVVSDSNQNLRFNPNNGELVAVDTPLAPAGSKVGVAYDRNVATATLTTMFVIDSTTNTLARQGGVDGTPSPNAGAITDIGPLGVDITAQSDFDISGSGVVRGVFGVGTGSGLYAINLTTGAATLIANFPAGTTVVDTSFIPAFPTQNAVSVPTMSTYGLLGLMLALAGIGLVGMRRRG